MKVTEKTRKIEDKLIDFVKKYSLEILFGLAIIISLIV